MVNKRYSWAQTYERCRRLASALQQRGIGTDDTVALMLPNIPAMFEAHFAIPMAGAVIHALNIRLDADAIAFQLQHGGARILITDREFSATVQAALAQLETPPLVIDVDDVLAPGGELIGEIEYEDLLAAAIRDFTGSCPQTSGRRLRSVTPRAQPAIPRAWSLITVAPI